ncbi:MAG: hypothetical protein M1829_002396 [Trizodia sp. TS-e1964]|nr:MAG: hypothetical protein M1829_002396 [Trizodia sp. TS-e1964]
MATQKIAVYSLPELKNTTDDALPNYLNSIKFKQSHIYTDVRLALGYTAAAIAGATFYLDFTIGFEKTKTLTLYAVIVYFILNSALTYWIWAVESGKVYVGSHPDGTKLSLESPNEKHDPTYRLRVRYLKPGSSEWHTHEQASHFKRWFTADGQFVAKPFQQWLATEIPVVGLADPKNVVVPRKDGSDLLKLQEDNAEIPAPGIANTPLAKLTDEPSQAPRSSGKKKIRRG